LNQIFVLILYVIAIITTGFFYYNKGRTDEKAFWKEFTEMMDDMIEENQEEE
jgi:uncharacterized protein YxeA